MYADHHTDSMRAALDETERRRAVQKAYNEEHGITPQGVKKAILELAPVVASDYSTVPLDGEEGSLPRERIPAEIGRLMEEMRVAADELEFEKAAAIRDRIQALKDLDLGLKPLVQRAAAGGASGGRPQRRGGGRPPPRRR
jgi:excinuclease ABC subunit B